MVESLLIGGISLLEVLHHEEAVTLISVSYIAEAHNEDVITQAAPDFAITLVEL